MTSIEKQMGESLSFQQALEQTVKDFGGRKNIQRMEWTYRKALSTLLLSLVVGTLEMLVLLNGFVYPALWSMLAILYLGFLDYSIKTAPELWHQTKIADH